MAVSRTQLADALRIADSSDTGDGPILDRLIVVAAATAALAAPGAPDGVADEAVIRFASWLYDAAPDSNTGAGWRSSGAAGLVDPWRRRSFALFGTTDPTGETGGGSDLPPFPDDGGSYILATNGGVLTWLKFPLP